MIWECLEAGIGLTMRFQVPSEEPMGSMYPIGGSEDDGDRNVTLNGRINADLTDNVKFSGSARYVDRKSEVDDTNYTTGKAKDASGLYSQTREFYTGAGVDLVSAGMASLFKNSKVNIPMLRANRMLVGYMPQKPSALI